jgi:Uma2 family endonuclease
VITGRLANDELGDGALGIAPDLVVEVISPRGNAEKVEEKIRQYLASGIRMIWAVYPRARVVRVIRPGGSETRLELADVLDGEDVLPGFRLNVADVFKVPAARELA